MAGRSTTRLFHVASGPLLSELLGVVACVLLSFKREDMFFFYCRAFVQTDLLPKILPSRPPDGRRHQKAPAKIALIAARGF